jgi:formin 2
MNMSSRWISRDGIKTLINLYPTTEELAAMKAAEQPSGPQLDKAERYLLTLASIPQFVTRLKCWDLNLEYPEALDSIIKPLHDLKVAVDEVTGSAGLRFVLSIILTFGNIMNGGELCRGAFDASVCPCFPGLRLLT